MKEMDKRKEGRGNEKYKKERGKIVPVKRLRRQVKGKVISL